MLRQARRLRINPPKWHQAQSSLIPNPLFPSTLAVNLNSASVVFSTYRLFIMFMQQPIKTSRKFDTKTLGDNQYYLSICLLITICICLNPLALICAITAFKYAHKVRQNTGKSIKLCVCCDCCCSIAIILCNRVSSFAIVVTCMLSLYL